MADLELLEVPAIWRGSYDEGASYLGDYGSERG
jgi:hypothetical protein